MNTAMRPAPPQNKPLLYRIAPGIAALAGYRREWFKSDLMAGVSVAAVALPTAIAYAEIIGLEPVYGLYAAIPALLAYAVFGTSRHLIVNPDAATCAMIAATLAPLATGDLATLVSMSVVLAVFTGLLCLIASALRLGFFADFLSKPILVGFLNGVAVSIFLGQIGKILGFKMASHGVIHCLIDFFENASQTNPWTLAVGLTVILVMFLSKRLLPRWPGPLLAAVTAIVVVKALHLESAGVEVVNDVPAGLPVFRWPTFDPHFLQPLFAGAMGVALVSFCNAMVVARSFAAKNNNEIDADRELAALGASQLAAGLCQGFAVSGTESRTAMNHAMGAKSQLAGLVAAVAMAFVLLFLTGPLRYLPKAALGGILIYAAIGLFDVKELRRLWRVSHAEFAVALLAMFGVIALDVLEGILVAVALSLLLLLKRSARPSDAILVRVPGERGFHSVARHPDAPRTPGVLIYRFEAAIVFYNASYFKKRVMELADAETGLKLLVIDGSTVNTIDSTGAETLDTLARALQSRGVQLGLAGFRTETRALLDRAGAMEVIPSEQVYPTLKSAIKAFLPSPSGQSTKPPDVPQEGERGEPA